MDEGYMIWVKISAQWHRFTVIYTEIRGLSNSRNILKQ
jgi:hypothetical protein